MNAAVAAPRRGVGSRNVFTGALTAPEADKRPGGALGLIAGNVA